MPVHRIETHAHTRTISPCSRLAPPELVALYEDAGYSALVVTDHLVATLPAFRGVRSWGDRVRRFFEGYRMANEAAGGTDLVVLPGFELTLSTQPGRDFLVYGIGEELLCDFPDIVDLDLQTFKRLANSVGGVVFQAHPYRYTTPVDPSLVDGVEVLNACPRHESNNDLAAAFAEEHDLHRVAGSDAHRREDVGRAGIGLPEAPRTSEELVHWLRDAPGEVQILSATRLLRGR
ncbi:MAG: PHP domain-containing protein [Spirochaetota bacterium]